VVLAGQTRIAHGGRSTLVRVTRRLLVVHAHPDDESISTGGMLAHYAATATHVTLVTCTLGEEGEIIPPELHGLAAAAADQLGGYRHAELMCACAELGVTDIRYLGGIGRFRDSGMVGAASAGHPRALARCAPGTPEFAIAVAELGAIIAEVGPQVVVSYDADGGYGHPDHLAAHRLARAAAAAGAASSPVRRFFAVIRPEEAVRQALATFEPAPGYHRPLASDLGHLAPPERVAVRLPVLDQRERHRRALAAHATQVDLLPSGFALSNRIAQPILDAEHFALLDGVPMPDGVATDLFAGLES
jgi:N-acetyl-1-D-myo-inositol-2-amino-2-deoxy-alpha-D-glucopyranoside deacetylase